MKFFLPNSIFCNFKNDQKSIFEVRKSLKLPEMQFHEKNILIYLISRVSFAWTYLNFLVLHHNLRHYKTRCYQHQQIPVCSYHHRCLGETNFCFENEVILENVSSKYLCYSFFPDFFSIFFDRFILGGPLHLCSTGTSR